MPHCKESIFTVILKRFFGSFVSVFGFILGIFLFFMLIGLAYKGNASTAGDILPIKVERSNTGYAATLSTSTPTILQINVEGVIGKINRHSMNTREMVAKILRQPSLYGIDTSTVKGLLLKINSPGGSASESDDIYQEIMTFKKKHSIPVHVWVGSMCASGGYYIACTGDHISAQTVSVIGSVGVLLSNPNFNFYGLMQKNGVESTPIAAGKNKRHFPMFSPSPKGKEHYQDILNLVDAIYERFTDVVADARASHGLTKEKIIELGATIYYGERAKQLGYIDQTNTTYNMAVQQFATALGIEGENYQVISFESPLSYLQNFQSKFDSAYTTIFGTKEEPPFSLMADLP
ncbi:S49 family peptidase [bacterium]|nr:S49 family peptidase [bacterium]